MKKTKKTITVMIAATVLLVAALINVLVYSVQTGNAEQWFGKKTEYVFEAESAVLRGCRDIPVDEKYKAGQNAVVGYIEENSSLKWYIDSSANESGANLTLRVSCPLGWIGVFNLPQSFRFDGLYTLNVNGEDIATNAHLLGSADVSDNGNYYYWANVCVDMDLKEGRNEILLTATNSQKAVYSSFGNVDKIAIKSSAELVQVRRP